LPKTVTRQRRGCDLNPGLTAPESSTLTTRLPSHPCNLYKIQNAEIDSYYISSWLRCCAVCSYKWIVGEWTQCRTRFNCGRGMQNRTVLCVRVHGNAVLLLRASDREAVYCDERVCVCVCVFVCLRSYLRNYTSNLHKIFMPVTYGPGSVLFWRCSDMLRISGFLDDVIFVHKPRLLDVAVRLRQ